MYNIPRITCKFDITNERPRTRQMAPLCDSHIHVMLQPLSWNMLRFEKIAD